MKLHRIQGGRRSGSGLLEIVIAAGVMIALLGAVGNAVLSSGRAYQQGLSSAVIEGHTRRLLERIASEFPDVDRSSLDPDPLAPFWTSSIEYARCTGWAAGAMSVGPRRAIQLALDQGELDNGMDDNGNGLVDEQRVLLVRDTSLPGDSIILGGYVRELAEGELPNGIDDNGNGLSDEPGLWFLNDGNGTLSINLTLEN